MILNKSERVEGVAAGGVNSGGYKCDGADGQGSVQDCGWQNPNRSLSMLLNGSESPQDGAGGDDGADGQDGAGGVVMNLEEIEDIKMREPEDERVFGANGGNAAGGSCSGGVIGRDLASNASLVDEIRVVGALDGKQKQSLDLIEEAKPKKLSRRIWRWIHQWSLQKRERNC